MTISVDPAKLTLAETSEPSGRPAGVVMSLCVPTYNRARFLEHLFPHIREASAAFDFSYEIVVSDNGTYGTIRLHQERDHPDRVVGTDLVNPDFARLAEAYGAHGETVTKTADFAAAFERAEASGKPALIELRLDPEAITPARSLSQIRAG